MALTQDQTEKLNEAIDNLNRSIEVNKEVLDVVKSVGNTGVVDIATHNTDKGAHSDGFNRVLVFDNIRIGYYAGSEINYDNLSYETKIEDGFVDTYHNVTNSSASPGIRGLNFKTGGSRLDPNTYLLTFYGRESYLAGSSRKYKTWASESYILGSDGEAQIKSTIFWADDSDSTNFYKSKTSFYADHNVDLGTSTFRFKDCYLSNSPIVASDKRLKQDFSDIPEAVFRAWGNVKFQQYRFKDAVSAKDDLARKHIGLVAQEIVEAFQAQGLNACDYGIVCYDSWQDQYKDMEVSYTPAVLDDKGNIITPEKTEYERRLVKPAGDVWTVRYEEALALESAYQRWKLAKIEAALAEKGIVL